MPTDAGSELEGSRGAGGCSAAFGDSCDGVEALHSSVAARREEAANVRRTANGDPLNICAFGRIDWRSILVQDEHTLFAAIASRDVWAMKTATRDSMGA